MVDLLPTREGTRSRSWLPSHTCTLAGLCRWSSLPVWPSIPRLTTFWVFLLQGSVATSFLSFRLCWLWTSDNPWT